MSPALRLSRKGRIQIAARKTCSQDASEPDMMNNCKAFQLMIMKEKPQGAL